MLMAPVLEAHDRERFEIVAISLGPDTGDVWRKRLERAVDTFVEARNMRSPTLSAPPANFSSISPST